MQTSVPIADLNTTQEASAPAVSWGPVIAGSLTAAAATLLLVLLGSGLGLTMVSPWSFDGVTATTFAVSTAVWLIIVQWISSALGGYLAGRLRTKWVGVHTDEVYFRDTAHGFLAWALATVLVAGVLGSALSSAVGTGVQAASTVASGAAMGASAGAVGQADNATSYFVDTLFRQTDSATPPAVGTADSSANATAQASRILLNSAVAGEVSADDQAYLGRLITQQTGLSEADAKARVDAVMSRIEAAKAQAKEAADAARKASATFAIVSAISLLIGAFIASVAAAVGGRQRDDDEVTYLSRR